VVPAEQPRSFTVDPRILERANAGREQNP